MRRTIWLGCLLFLSCWPQLTWAQGKNADQTFLFHEEVLSLPSGGQGWPPAAGLRVSEAGLRQAYRRLATSNYPIWLNALKRTAERLRLNDWLYCELVMTAVRAHYGTSEPTPTTTLVSYFLLAKSGFDVLLTYRDQRVCINIHTLDEIFEVPLIREGGRSYANITMIKTPPNQQRQSMFLLDQRPNPTGRACSFILREWPLLYVAPKQRAVAFKYHGLPMEVAVEYNAGIPKLLANYPLVEEQWYLEAPLSEELRASLITSLRETTAEMAEADALALLASFTRSAFQYKNDNEVFGINKPMVGDELFFYPYSDCEDRSALFYALVKDILALPMLVIAYDDHLTIAVATEEVSGDVIRYEGQRFVFCDPTGPASSSEIGRIPPGYENKSFEIIGVYEGD